MDFWTGIAYLIGAFLWYHIGNHRMKMRREKGLEGIWNLSVKISHYGGVILLILGGVIYLLSYWIE